MRFTNHKFVCGEGYDNTCALLSAIRRANQKLVHDTVEQFCDVAVPGLVQALVSLYKSYEAGVVCIDRRRDVVERHEFVDPEACCNVVNRQLHLVWSEYRVTSEGVGDVKCLAWYPCDCEAEVEQLLPDVYESPVVEHV